MRTNSDLTKLLRSRFDVPLSLSLNSLRLAWRCRLWSAASAILPTAFVRHCLRFHPQTEGPSRKAPGKARSAPTAPQALPQKPPVPRPSCRRKRDEPMCRRIASAPPDAPPPPQDPAEATLPRSRSPGSGKDPRLRPECLSSASILPRLSLLPAGPGQRCHDD